jgi:carbon monoxide dehydrogenase subunit G
MIVDVAITIDAAPETVWEVIEPIERHVDWMADAASITFTSEQTRGPGTSFDCVTKIGPFRTVDKMVVTEWSPAQTMGIEHRGLVTGTGRFTLTPLGAGRTEFAWTEQLNFPRWMGGRAGEVAAQPVLRAVWRRNLRHLKALVEGS